MSNSNKTKNDFEAAVKKMSDAGISFAVGGIEYGMLHLNVAEVLRYVEDKAQFFADKHNVSVETVKEYQLYMQNFERRRCAFIEEGNQQCRKRILEPKSLINFNENRLDYCKLHNQT